MEMLEFLENIRAGEFALTFSYYSWKGRGQTGFSFKAHLVWWRRASTLQSVSESGRKQPPELGIPRGRWLYLHERDKANQQRQRGPAKPRGRGRGIPTAELPPPPKATGMPRPARPLATGASQEYRDPPPPHAWPRENETICPFGVFPLFSNHFW